LKEILEKQNDFVVQTTNFTEECPLGHQVTKVMDLGYHQKDVEE
jgi:hypothetical protein